MLLPVRLEDQIDILKFSKAKNESANSKENLDNKKELPKEKKE